LRYALAILIALTVWLGTSIVFVPILPGVMASVYYWQYCREHPSPTDPVESPEGICQDRADRGMMTEFKPETHPSG